MKTRILLSFLFLVPFLRASEKSDHCGCDCCQGAKTCCCAPKPAATEPPAQAAQPKSHPLKGVIMGVMTEKTALLVKHEEVPGVMRAMTMMFKVEPAVLEKVKRGDAITGLMSRRADGWWLHDVQVTEPAK